MDLQLLSFPIIISLFVFVLTVLITLKRSSITVKSISKLPPGPWKLPIIGNLHQLLGSLPHRRLFDLARIYGPLMYIKIGQVPTLVVSSPEYAKEVMKTHDAIFASRPSVLFAEIVHYNSTGLLFAPYGDYWRKVRKICIQELLSPARVQTFSGIRREEMFNLMEWISSNVGSTINLTKRINALTCSLIARATFGNKMKDQEEFILAVEEASKAAAGFDLADVFPSFSFLDPLIFGTRAKLEKLRQKNDRIIGDIIKEYKEKKQETKGESETITEDLVDVLLKFLNSNQHEFSLTPQNITAILFDIFTGGTETSSTVLDWTMVELIKNPRAMKKAQNEVREVFIREGSVEETAISELKYLRATVKEAMRLHPSASLLVPRESREKCEINGYLIPSKTRVLVNSWAIGRDPTYWTDPESFIPERFLENPMDYKGSHFEFIPFGAGRRTCPGMSFGLINVELPLAMLLCHFDWKLPSGVKPEDLDMTEVPGISTRRKDELHLVPTAYEGAPIVKTSMTLK